MFYDLGPIERYLRRRLDEVDRRRFDRAKRFVDATGRAVRDESGHRMNARWLKFLCGRSPVQTDIWPEDADFLRRFAILFGLPPAEARAFVMLSLLGRLWRAWCFHDLLGGPPEVVGRLTRVAGWEHFDACRRDGGGVVLVPVHSQFSRLIQPYLRHRGHEGLEVGTPNQDLAQQGFRTAPVKRFELARQMHAAKHRLAQGGIVLNAPDAREHLDHARSVAFFGRQRPLAAGFAELALKSGASVVPVAYRFSPRGFFVLEFRAPFRALGPQTSHEERIDSLVGQYASFLRDEWRRCPWNIQWRQLRYYCELPEIASGPSNVAAAAISPGAQPLAQ